VVAEDINNEQEQHEEIDKDTPNTATPGLNEYKNYA
jgi:hypothetical protein